MNPVDSIIGALRGVLFPGLERDIVSLGYVKDIREEGGRQIIEIEMSTSLPDAEAWIAKEANAALTTTGIPYDLRLQIRSPQPAASAPVGAPGLLPEIPYKIAVASGKGGVGKSTVAVNLALAFARLGHRVGLLDCDVYGPSIPLMLGMENERPVLRNEKLVPLTRYDIRSISIGYLVDRHTPVIWRGPMVAKALDQLMTEVDWEGTEILVMDLPPGTGDIQITIAQKVALTGAVIVTTPQDVALVDAAKGFAMFQKVNVPILGIVENMSVFSCPHCGKQTEIFRAGGGQREADRLGVPLLAEIPIDPRIPIGGDLGNPIVAQNPDSPAARAFLLAAESIWSVIRARA